MRASAASTTMQATAVSGAISPRSALSRSAASRRPPAQTPCQPSSSTTAMRFCSRPLAAMLSASGSIGASCVMRTL